jgi:hypothetical protein
MKLGSVMGLVVPAPDADPLLGRIERAAELGLRPQDDTGEGRLGTRARGPRTTIRSGVLASAGKSPGMTTASSRRHSRDGSA